MKTNNKKKVVVSVLALAMGAGLAGSISGSVAWYQYSTRTTAQLQGVSAGTTRNLQVRIADGTYNAQTGDWTQDLTQANILAYLQSLVAGENKPASSRLNPVTIKTSDKTASAALAQRDLDNNPDDEVHNYVPAFSGHPVYQYSALPEINSALAGTGADTTFNYIQIPLEFRVMDNTDLKAKDIYVVDASFKDTNTSDSFDIRPALRLHFSNGLTGDNAVNKLVAYQSISTNVSGLLDLNKNDKKDRNGFTGDDATNTDTLINYGGADQTKTVEGDVVAETQASLAAYSNAETPAQLEGKYTTGDTEYNYFIANDDNAYTFVGGQKLGTTTTSGDALKVTLTIWLEGWAELGDSNIWSKDYSGLAFDLGLRFACEADA